MSDIDDCLKSVERLTRDREEVMRAGNDKIAEIERLREKNEMLIVTITMIERMAAGAIYSQESIHASAIGALKQLRGKP